MIGEAGVNLVPKSGMTGDGFLLDDELQVPLSFHRMDSLQIEYQPRRKQPKFISKYLMGEKLGEGAYSKVKEVLDTETLERRAAKIMKVKRLRRIPRGEQNAQREIHVHRKLRHENVVRLIDVFFIEEKDKFYIIMEYCPVVLKELLDSVPTMRLPIWQSAEYFQQLICGLEYLHSQSIIHYDIKPGNLLLDNSGVIKITDFGVSEELDRFRNDDLCDKSQGTPTFQPPEVADIKSHAIYGFKLDVWSSGVTLFNIVTGEYPFAGENVYRLFENIVRCDFSFPSHLDDELLMDLITQMLRKDPIQRFSVQQIQNHQWFRKKHARICDPVPIPVRNGGDNDQWRSTSVLPYLKALYDPSGDLYEDGDSDLSGSETRGQDCDLRHEDLTPHPINENNNNESRGPRSRSACRPSKASAFLSCLGVGKDKCNQS